MECAQPSDNHLPTAADLVLCLPFLFYISPLLLSHREETFRQEVEKKPIWSFYLRWQLTRVDSTLPDKNHSRSFVWITHTHRVGSLFNPFPERKSFFLFFFFFFIDLSYSGHCVKSISATTNVTAADASGFQIKMCVSNRKETRVAVNWNPRSRVSFWTRLAVSKRFPLYWKIFPASVSNSGFVSHSAKLKKQRTFLAGFSNTFLAPPFIFCTDRIWMEILSSVQRFQFLGDMGYTYWLPVIEWIGWIDKRRVQYVCVVF